MIRSRLSSSARNRAIQESRPRKAESNADWLRRAHKALGEDSPKLLMLGGTNLFDFRLRIAQSHARADMKPSFWSHVGLLLPSSGKGGFELWHVPLETSDAASLSSRNAIEKANLDHAADKTRFPNLALIEFPGAEAATLEEAVGLLTKSRLSLDLVTPVIHWIAFACGAGTRGNPLLEGVALPAASFVEAAFGHAGIDLSPGLSERTSCPEAIWQAALWWGDFYSSAGGSPSGEGKTEGKTPRGAYTLGQPAAAIVD